MIKRGIVIGCGNIAVLYEADESRPWPRSHAGALVLEPRTELTAFVGVDVRECERASAVCPARTYIDLGECLANEKPDIAIIAASTAAHAPLTAQCLAANIPIIIGEKPVAASLAEARALRDDAAKSTSVFALNYQRRFFPFFIEARKRLASGALGVVTGGTCVYDNGVFNNGGHAIDAVRMLLGCDIAAVSAHDAVNNPTHPAGDLNLDGELRMKDGARIALASHDRSESAIHDIHIEGDAGSLFITDFGYVFEWRDSSGVVRERQEDRRSMTRDVLSEALDAAEKGRAPWCGFEEGIRVLEVLEALRESARGGGRVVELGVH